MHKLKVKFELNKGRIGIPFAKLAHFSSEAHKFLELIANDVGVNSPEWIARDFQNNSVDFDCECIVDDDALWQVGYDALQTVLSGRKTSPVSALIQPRTWTKFSDMFKAIDSDEVVRIGIYNGGTTPEMFEITKDRATSYAPQRGTIARYYGEIQGIIHTFFKEASPPRFVVRELSTKALVACIFDRENPAMYHTAVELLLDKGAVIFIEGDIEEDTESGLVKTIYVKDFLPAVKFDLSKYQSALGAHPDVTGELSTEEFIEQMRSNGEAT
jgi:hypothetical protein